MPSADGARVRGVVALSYELPASVEAKLIRDAEARSVQWRQRHGEGLFSPDEWIEGGECAKELRSDSPMRR